MLIAVLRRDIKTKMLLRKPVKIHHNSKRRIQEISHIMQLQCKSMNSMTCEIKR